MWGVPLTDTAVCAADVTEHGCLTSSMVATTPAAPLSANRKDLAQQLTGVRSISEELQTVITRPCFVLLVDANLARGWVGLGQPAGRVRFHRQRKTLGLVVQSPCAQRLAVSLNGGLFLGQVGRTRLAGTWPSSLKGKCGGQRPPSRVRLLHYCNAPVSLLCCPAGFPLSSADCSLL
jgi:hypothetical protein